MGFTFGEGLKRGLLMLGVCILFVIFWLAMSAYASRFIYTQPQNTYYNNPGFRSHIAE